MNRNINRILACLSSLPEEYGLTDVFNALSGDISYDEIRICLSNLDFVKQHTVVNGHPIEAIWQVLHGDNFTFFSSEILVFKEDYYLSTLDGNCALMLWRQNTPTINLYLRHSSQLDVLRLSKLRSAALYIQPNDWMMHPNCCNDYFEIQKSFGWDENGILNLTITSKNDILSITLEALSTDGYRYILRASDTKYLK